MKSTGILLAILGALFVATYATYLYKFPTYTYRYKMTVDVEVDGKVVSGSAVREVRRWHQLITFGFPFAGDLDGEAVVVDLGSRGLLFATMYTSGGLTNDAIMTPERVFTRSHKLPKNFHGDLSGEREELWRQLVALRDCADMLPKEWPLFVHFGNIQKSDSVQRVDPLHIADSMGAGVEIKTVRICLVNEPVTHAIAKTLFWITTLPNGRLSTTDTSTTIHANASFSEKMQGDAFIRARRE